MTKLYIDQYGYKFYAATVKELRQQIGNGGSKVSKMYVDSNKDGKTYQTGYVIGNHWLTCFEPMRKAR